MKTFYLFFSSLIVAALFTGCAGNKNLQERAPAQLGEAYIVTDASSMKLHIPVRSIQLDRVSLDSVYFRGRAAVLEQDPSTPGHYTALFNTGKPDLIMSSDPKEEYENKMPRTAAKSPFKLDDDEAVIVFSQNAKTKYYKLTGIKERSAN